MGLPTKGTLSELDFITLLEQAAADKLTGMVRLETGSLIKVVYLQQGTIAFASSNEKSDRLTEVLRRAGKLTPEQIEHAQSRLRPNVSLGKTLVELGYVSPKDLLWGARMQVEGIVHQLLYWSQGNFQIHEGPVPKEIVSLNLSIPHVLFDGLLKTHDRQWVLKHIGSPDAIYRITPDFHEKNVTYKFPVEEIVSRMNGKRTLEEIADAAGKDTFEVCKTVVALEKLKLVERIHEKPLQMHLIVPEATEPEVVETEPEPSPEPVNIFSFGQLAQIPAVQDLQPVDEDQVFEQPSEEPVVDEEPSGPIQLLPIAEDEEEPFDSRIVRDVISPPSAPAPKQDAPKIAVPLESLSELKKKYEDQEGMLIDWRKMAVVISVLALAGIAAIGYYWHKAQPDISKQPPFIEERSTPPDAQPVSEPPAIPDKIEPAREVAPATNTDSDPLTLAKSGRLPKAALAWQKMLLTQKRKVTLQLEIACQEKTVTDAISLLQNPNELYVIPMKYNGRPCYRVLYGTYSSPADAQEVRANLPADFLHLPSTPQIVPVARILP